MIRANGLKTTLLLVGWAGLVLTSFWQFEGRELRPAARPKGAALALPDRLPDIPMPLLATNQGTIAFHTPNGPTLLNFWNPECACSRFMETHVRALHERFAPHGLRLITIVECGRTLREQRAAQEAWQSRGMADIPFALDVGGALARNFGVWAAPAAVLLDPQGHTAYVGAYNSARFCMDAHTAWAEQAITALLHGKTPARATSLFYGCQVLPEPIRHPSVDIR